ncbi:Uncharacterised protein [Klebsiella quasipneumoniae]|nr:Uncharacterised protein [Klebsiella quasipneumoniae]
MVFLLMGGAYLRSRIKQAGKWDQETIVSFFLCQYCSGEYLHVILDVMQKWGPGPQLAMAETLRHNAAFEPKRMLDFMPRIHNIHAKFYEMTDEISEWSIPYDEIFRVLQKGGYEGYVCSEYEGNRWVEDAQEVDSLEQVRRQQLMFCRLLDETPPPALLGQ